MNNYAEELKKDKDDMKEGNDQFLNVIYQIIAHETKRTQLEEKLKILRSSKVYTKKTNEIGKQAENYLHQQVEVFQKYQNELQEVLTQKKKEEEVIRRRYEEEKKKRSEVEKTLFSSKKDLKQEQQKIAVLMAEKIILNKKLEFLREGFKEEIKELESHIQNEKKVISNTKRRSLDLDPIIQPLEIHYAEIAERTKQETHQLNMIKIETLRQTSEQYKKEIEKISKKKTDLERELDMLKEKVESLKKKLEQEDKEKTKLISELEKKLKVRKEELVQQVCDYQKLLNLKMGLDMEIVTYRELLKNEEESLKDTSSEVYKTIQTKASAKEKIHVEVVEAHYHYEEIVSE